MFISFWYCRSGVRRSTKKGIEKQIRERSEKLAILRRILVRGIVGGCARLFEKVLKILAVAGFDSKRRAVGSTARPSM